MRDASMGPRSGFLRALSVILRGNLTILDVPISRVKKNYSLLSLIFTRFLAYPKKVLYNEKSAV